MTMAKWNGYEAIEIGQCMEWMRLKLEATLHVYLSCRAYCVCVCDVQGQREVIK